MGGIYHYMPSVFIEIPHHMPFGLRFAFARRPHSLLYSFHTYLEKVHQTSMWPSTSGLIAISSSTCFVENVKILFLRSLKV